MKLKLNLFKQQLRKHVTLQSSLTSKVSNIRRSPASAQTIQIRFVVSEAREVNEILM